MAALLSEHYTVDELTEVEGVGKTRAGKIREILD